MKEQIFPEVIATYVEPIVSILDHPRPHLAHITSHAEAWVYWLNLSWQEQ